MTDTDAPIFAMRADGRICVNTADGRAYRAKSPGAKCGCDDTPAPSN